MMTDCSMIPSPSPIISSRSGVVSFFNSIHLLSPTLKYYCIHSSAKPLSSCLFSFSILREQDIVAAGAKHVAETSAQLATVTSTPADTHVGGDILLHAHVALVVAILADRDALEPRTGALEMSLATQVFLGWSAGQDFSGSAGHGGRVLPRNGACGQSVEHLLRVVEGVSVRVGDEVGVCVDVVGVQDVAKGEGWHVVGVDVPLLFPPQVGDFEAGELAGEAGQGRRRALEAGDPECMGRFGRL